VSSADLHVYKEENVYEIMLLWLRHNVQARSDSFCRYSRQLSIKTRIRTPIFFCFFLFHRAQNAFLIIRVNIQGKRVVSIFCFGLLLQVDGVCAAPFHQEDLSSGEYRDQSHC